MVSKGQIGGIDWNRIVQLHSHVLAHMNSLTALRCVYVSPRIYIISCCCYFSVNILKRVKFWYFLSCTGKCSLIGVHVLKIKCTIKREGNKCICQYNF